MSQSDYGEITVIVTIIATVVMLVVVLVPVIFYFINIMGTMDAIEEQNRPLPGALIWLSLVPCVGMLWFSIFVILLSSALDKELVKRRLPSDNGALGIAFGVTGLLMLVPYLNILALLPFLVLWIIHWVKTAEIKNQLRNPY